MRGRAGALFSVFVVSPLNAACERNLFFGGEPAHEYFSAVRLGVERGLKDRHPLLLLLSACRNMLRSSGAIKLNGHKESGSQ